MTICVVSGMLRSGTSMMMKMLESGGMQLFEDQAISHETKQMLGLPRKWQWLRQCENKAVKILEPLYYRPAAKFDYKIIWMDRDPMQQARSQAKLLAMLSDYSLDSKHLLRLSLSLIEDTPKSVALLESLGPVLRVKFEHIIDRPNEAAHMVAEFIGNLDIREMERVVIPRTSKCLPYMLETKLIA